MTTVSQKDSLTDNLEDVGDGVDDEASRRLVSNDANPQISTKDNAGGKERTDDTFFDDELPKSTSGSFISNLSPNIDEEIERLNKERESPESAINDTKRLLDEIDEKMEKSFELMEENQNSVKKFIQEREKDDEKRKNKADEIMKRLDEGMKKLEELQNNAEKETAEGPRQGSRKNNSEKETAEGPRQGSRKNNGLKNQTVHSTVPVVTASTQTEVERTENSEKQEDIEQIVDAIKDNLVDILKQKAAIEKKKQDFEFNHVKTELELEHEIEKQRLLSALSNVSICEDRDENQSGTTDPEDQDLDEAEKVNIMTDMTGDKIKLLTDDLKMASKKIQDLLEENKDLQEKLGREFQEGDMLATSELFGNLDTDSQLNDSIVIPSYDVERILGCDLGEALRENHPEGVAFSLEEKLRSICDREVEDLPLENILKKLHEEYKLLSDNAIESKVVNEVNEIVTIASPEKERVKSDVEREKEEAAKRLTDTKADLASLEKEINSLVKKNQDMALKLSDHHHTRNELEKSLKDTNADIARKFTIEDYQEVESDMLHKIQGIKDEILKKANAIEGLSRDGFLENIGENDSGSLLRSKKIIERKIKLVQQGLGDQGNAVPSEELGDTEPSFKDIEDALVVKIDLQSKLNDLDWQIEDLELDRTVRNIKVQLEKAKRTGRKSSKKADLEILLPDMKSQAEVMDLNAQMKQLNITADELDDLKNISSRLRWSLVETEKDLRKKITSMFQEYEGREEFAKDGNLYLCDLKSLASLTTDIEGMTKSLSQSRDTDTYPNISLIESVKRTRRHITSAYYKEKLKVNLRTKDDYLRVLGSTIEALRAEKDRLFQFIFASNILQEAKIVLQEAELDYLGAPGDIKDVEIESKLIDVINHNANYIKSALVEIENILSGNKRTDTNSNLALSKIQEDIDRNKQYLTEINSYVENGKEPFSIDNPINNVLKMKKNLITNLNSISSNINHHMNQNGDPHLLDIFVRKKLQIQNKLDHADKRIMDKKDGIERIIEALKHQEIILLQKVDKDIHLSSNAVPQPEMYDLLKESLGEHELEATDMDENKLETTADSDLLEMLKSRHAMLEDLKSSKSFDPEDLKDLEFDIDDMIESYLLPNSKKNLWYELDRDEVTRIKFNIVQLKQAKIYMESVRFHQLPLEDEQSIRSKVMHKISAKVNNSDIISLKQANKLIEKKHERLEHIMNVFEERIAQLSTISTPLHLEKEEEACDRQGNCETDDFSKIYEDIKKVSFCGEGCSPGSALFSCIDSLQDVGNKSVSDAVFSTLSSLENLHKITETPLRSILLLALAERQQLLQKTLEIGKMKTSNSNDKLLLDQEQMIDMIKTLDSKWIPYLIGASREHSIDNTDDSSASTEMEIVKLLEERDKIFHELWETEYNAETNQDNVVKQGDSENALRNALKNIDSQFLKSQKTSLEFRGSLSIPVEFFSELATMVIAEVKSLREESLYREVYIYSNPDITHDIDIDVNMEEETKAKTKMEQDMAEQELKLSEQMHKVHIEQKKLDQFLLASKVEYQSTKQRLSLVHDRDDLIEMIKEVDDRIALLERKQDLESRIRDQGQNGEMNEAKITGRDWSEAFPMFPYETTADSTSVISSPIDSISSDIDREDLLEKYQETKEKLEGTNKTLFSFLNVLQDKANKLVEVDSTLNDELISSNSELITAMSSSLGDELAILETEKEILETKLKSIRDEVQKNLNSPALTDLLKQRREQIQTLGALSEDGEETKLRMVQDTLQNQLRKARARKRELEWREKYDNTRLAKLQDWVDRTQDTSIDSKARNVEKDDERQETKDVDLKRALGDDLTNLILHPSLMPTNDTYIKDPENALIQPIIAGVLVEETVEVGLRKLGKQNYNLKEELEDLRDEIARKDAINENLQKKFGNLEEEFQSMTEKIMQDEELLDILRKRLGSSLFHDVVKNSDVAEDDSESNLEAVSIMNDQSLSLQDVLKMNEETATTLFNENRNFEDKMVVCKADYDKIKLENEELVKTASSLKDEILHVEEDMRKHKESFADKLAQLQNSLNEKEEEFVLVMEQVDVLTTDIEVKNKTINELQEKIETLETELDKLDDESGIPKAQEISSKQESSYFEDLVDTDMNEDNEVEVSFATSRDQVHNLQSELESRDKDLAEKKQEIENLLFDINSIRRELEKIISEKDDISKKLQESNRNIQQWMDERDKIQSLLTKELDNFRSTDDKLYDIKNESLHNRIGMLLTKYNDEMLSLKETMQRASDEAESRRLQVDALQTSLVELRQSHDMIKENLRRERESEIKKLLTEKDRETAQLVDKNTSLAEKLTEVTNNLEKTENELESLSQGHRELTDRGAEMLQILEMLEEENKSKSLRIEELKEELKESGLELIHVKENIEKEKEVIAKRKTLEHELNVSLQEKENQLEKLRETISELQQALDGKSSELHQLKQKEQFFRDGIQSLESKLEGMEKIAKEKDQNLKQVEKDLGNIKENHIEILAGKQELEEEMSQRALTHQKQIKLFQEKNQILENLIKEKEEEIAIKTTEYKEKLNEKEKNHSLKEDELNKIVENLKVTHSRTLGEIEQKLELRDEDVDKLKREYTKQLKEMKDKLENESTLKEKLLQNLQQDKEDKINKLKAESDEKMKVVQESMKRKHEKELEELRVRYESELNKRKKSIEKLQKHLAEALDFSREEFADDLRRSNHKIQELNNEIDNISNKLGVEKGNRENLKKRVKELEGLSETLEGDNVELKRQCIQYELKEKENDEIIKEHDNLIRKLNQEIKLEKKENKDLQFRKEQLAKEINILNTKVSSLEAQVNENAKVIELYRQRLKEQKQKRQEDSLKWDSDRKQLENHVSEKERLIETLNRKSETDFESSIKSLRQSFEEEKRTRNISINEQLSSFQRMVKEMEIKLDDKEDIINSLKESVQTLKAENESKVKILNERKEEQRRQINNLQTKISELETRIEDKSSELILKGKELERLRREREEDRRLSEMKDDKIRQLKKRLTEQRSDFECIKEKLEHEILEKKASLLSCQTDLDNIKFENGELREVQKDLKSKINEQQSYQEYEAAMEKRKNELEELRKVVDEQKQQFENEMKSYFEKAQDVVRQESENRLAKEMDKKRVVMNKEIDKISKELRQCKQELEASKQELWKTKETMQQREIDLKQDEKLLIENLENEFKRKMEEIIRHSFKEKEKMMRNMKDDRLKLEDELESVKRDMRDECQRKLTEQKQDLERDFQDALYELLKESKESVEELQEKISVLEEEKVKLHRESELEKEGLKRQYEAERAALEGTVKELLKNLVRYREERIKLKGKHREEIDNIEEEVETEKEKLELRRQQDLLNLREKLHLDYKKSLENEKHLMENKLERLKHDNSKGLSDAKGFDYKLHSREQILENDIVHFQLTKEKERIRQELQMQYDKKLTEETEDIKRKIMEMSEQLVAMQQGRRL